MIGFIKKYKLQNPNYKLLFTAVRLYAKHWLI